MSRSFTLRARRAFPGTTLSATTLAILLAACGGSGSGGSGPPDAAFQAFADVALQVGATPSASATGDLDGDGRLDLIVANSGTNNVSVALGTAGGFSAATSFAAGGSVEDVAVADVNGDGNLDVLATINNGGVGSLIVLTGDGTGSLFAGGTLALPASAEAGALVAGRFNNDAWVDVAVVGPNDDILAVALGSAIGFSAFTTTPLVVGFAGQDIVAFDADADGDLDLGISSATQGTVQLLLGNGMGAFAPGASVLVDVGADLAAMATLDVNRDGDLDLVVVNRTAGTAVLLIGNGTGTFALGTSLASGADARAVAVGDFNLDGRTDLAVALGASGDVAVHFANGSGTFASPLFVDGGANTIVALSTSDVTLDGSLDLILVHEVADSVTILAGLDYSIDFALVAGTSLSGGAGASLTSVAAADLNGNGTIDVFASDGANDAILTFAGNGNGGFGGSVATAMAPGADARAIAMADIDFDGDMDVLIANPGTDTVSVALGGGGTLTMGLDIALSPGGDVRALALADFDHDGDLDVVMVNSVLANIELALGNGNGTFAAATSVALAVGFDPRGIVATDLDGDGDLDLAVTSGSTGSVSILLGDGLGGFAAPTTVVVAAGTELQGIVAADLNRDGNMDLAVANTTTGTIGVLRGNGNGTFQPALSFTAAAGAQALAVGDLNRDGRLDIVVAAETASQAAILFGTGAGTFVAPQVYASGGLQAEWIALADLDRNGILDVMVAHSASGEVGLLFGTD